MITTFTPNDVITYIYGDRPTISHEEISLAISTDELLAETFYETQSIIKLLNKGLLEPSAKCINNILDFSRNYSAK